MSGDYTVADTLYFLFTTRRFSTGAPFALAGSPVISAYENEGLTQITAGVSLGVDHDGVTGLNLCTVVASGANGFESGKDYHLVITTGTVDSVSVVGEVIGRFTLQRSAAAVDLANGTDGLGAIKTDTAAILVDTGTTLDARIPAALVSGRMDVSVGAMAANVLTAAAINAAALNGKGDWNIGKTGYALSGTQTFDLTGNITGNLSGSVGSVTGAVGSVTGNVGGNVTGSVGSVVGAVGSVTGAVGSVTGLTASDVGAIKAKTDSLTFTQAGHVDANIQRINDVAITGDGSGTPFNV